MHSLTNLERTVNELKANSAAPLTEWIVTSLKQAVRRNNGSTATLLATSSA